MKHEKQDSENDQGQHMKSNETHYIIVEVKTTQRHRSFLILIRMTGHIHVVGRCDGSFID